MIPGRPRGRFKAHRKTAYKGELYASKAEADFAARLDLEVRAGTVTSWRRQVPFPLVVNDSLVYTYRADFVVLYPDGSEVVVDIKGWPNDRWPMVKKLFYALHRKRIAELRPIAGGFEEIK